MELILKSNDKTSIAKIVALAIKLNVTIEKQDQFVEDNGENEELKKRILNFQAKGVSSFCDAADWQRDERKDRELPFSK